jgi:uncharacterized membrane protein
MNCFLDDILPNSEKLDYFTNSEKLAGLFIGNGLKAHFFDQIMLLHTISFHIALEQVAE